MDREFLDLYNRELQLLHEQAREFAEEYPGIAERLGGLVADRMDPMVAGLLEGTAFLAARVQLKLKHEFPEFTGNLLEQLVPNYLAPTPSAMLARIIPPYRRPGAARRAPHRARVVSRRDLPRARPQHRLPLSPDVRHHPVAVRCRRGGILHHARAVAGARPFGRARRRRRNEAVAHAPDRGAARGRAAGRRSRARLPTAWFAGCRAAELPVYLVGNEADAVALYEQLFADCGGVLLPLSRRVRRSGHRARARRIASSQIGFDEADALLPSDSRIFRGFDLLREYFMLPRKFLGFRLDKLAAVLPRLPAKSVDILFAFDEVNTAAARRGAPGDVRALYGAGGQPVREDDRPRRRQVEPARIPRRPRPQPLSRFRAAPHSRRLCALSGRPRQGPGPSALLGAGREAADRIGDSATPCAACRGAAPSRRRKYGAASDYTGTDMFISLVEPAGIEDESRRCRAQRPRAVLQPASDRASSGRRGRRGLPPARGRRRSTSSASPDRRRRAGRWSDSCAAEARPPTPAR